MRLGSCKSLIYIWNDYLTFFDRLTKTIALQSGTKNQRDFYDRATYDASLTDLPIIFANLIVSYTKENNCFRGDCIIGMQHKHIELGHVLRDQEMTK